MFLTAQNLNTVPMNPSLFQIQLENGDRVALKENYMEQITLKKNNLPYDKTWLIEHEGKMVFHTRSEVVLPIIINTLQTQNTLQTPTYQVMEFGAYFEFGAYL